MDRGVIRIDVEILFYQTNDLKFWNNTMQQIVDSSIINKDVTKNIWNNALKKWEIAGGSKIIDEENERSMEANGIMDRETILRDYQEQGFAVIPNALTEDELAYLNELVDKDIVLNPADWHAPHQGASGNGQILMKYPELDRFVRHPKVFPLIEKVLGEEARFAQVDFRDVRAEKADQSGMNFHRDISYYGGVGGKTWDPDNPYKSTFNCIIYYLKDVLECCPCFCMVPNSHEYETLDEAKEALGDAYREVPIRGKAGTAILYNITTYHTRVNGQTGCSHGRRTLHNYHSRRSNAPLTEWATVPEVLAMSQDEATRRFYSQWTPGQIRYALHNYKQKVPSWYPTVMFKS